MLEFKFNSKKTIVGFNTGHHGGCCIIHKNKIIAIAEERLNRKKYSEGYLYSLFYCLKELNISIYDIDLFVSSSYHKELPKKFQGDLNLLGLDKNKFISVDHHLSHAYSSYFLSSFNDAIIIVIDGLGNNFDTESYYLAKNNLIKKIGGNNTSRSIYKGIGRTYETFTNFCGWSAQEAGKTMGLASYGKDKYPKIQLYSMNKKEQIESLVEGKYYQASLNFIKEKRLNFGKPFSSYSNKNAAYFVQNRTEKIIIELINRLYKKYKVENLCLAGGVFLNSILNQKILDQTEIKNLFIPACCDDTGQAFGNALYGFHKYYKNNKIYALPHSYLGREYTEEEILDVLNKEQNIFVLPYEVKSKSFKFKKCKDICKETAELLVKGNIIGWFQGGSEIGPRALGHRSILCAPFPIKMKQILNSKIKHREAFRPFAPSILKNYLSEYFEMENDSPFMLRVAKTKKPMWNKVPAIMHIDKTARVQTVTSKNNGIYYKLIKNFYKISGIPLVLNTSFNNSGEPIVETPKDAMVMFCKTQMDYLVMGDYLIWKE